MSKRAAFLRELAGYTAYNEHEDAYRQRVLEFVREVPDAYLRRHLAGHMTASALVINAERDAVLLLHHAKLDRWLQPGGHADGEEDLELVARTEVAEETGLTELSLGQAGIFDLDIHEIPARKEVPAHLHYDVRYLFQASPGASIQKNAESNALAWIPKSEILNYTEEESVLRMLRKLKFL